jgi:hypothetical protein
MCVYLPAHEPVLVLFGAEVIGRSLTVDLVRDTYEVREAFTAVAKAIQAFKQRPCRSFPSFPAAVV